MRTAPSAFFTTSRRSSIWKRFGRNFSQHFTRASHAFDFDPGVCRNARRRRHRLRGTPFAKWTEKEWVQLGIEGQNWTLSQFLHGEQGALLCTARIVETVPWIDAKYYAATQVMDEARHVEVFARYLDEKLDGSLPDQRAPAACCSTTSSPTAAGT